MGFFSRKPNRADVKKLVAISQKAMPLFVRLAQSGSVKFGDGRSVDLKDPHQLVAVRSAIQRLVNDLGLADLPPRDIETVVNRARRIHDHINATTYDASGPIIETAQHVVSGLDAHELICFNYYKLYPSFEPLREMIDSSSRIIARAVAPIFDEMPDDIKQAFPHFSEQFLILGSRTPPIDS